MNLAIHSILKDFVVLDPDKNASVEHFDNSLYERLDKNYDAFKGHELVSCYEFTEDWSTWERHPRGDEIVILLSGSAQFVLQMDDTQSSIQLDEVGSYIIVPKNRWHTVKTSTPTRMLFITPGEGTENKSV